MDEQAQRLKQAILYKEIAQTLNKGMEKQDILQKVLGKVLEMTGFHSGWIFLRNREGTLSLYADRQLPPALLSGKKKAMCSQDCYCIERFHDGRLSKALNVVNCKRLEQSIQNKEETNGLTHHASVALRSEDELFGILNIASKGERYFQKAELEQLEAIALLIGNTLKRIQLTEEWRERAIFEERYRLSGDLHDSVNQLLFSINLLAKAGGGMERREDLRATLADIQGIAQVAQEEMKELVWHLRTPILERGVLPALKHYGRTIGVDVTGFTSGENQLNNDIQKTLFRIGQEGINNVKKHSGTQSVDVGLSIKNGQAVMNLSDNGCGFDPKLINYKESIGIENIKHRASRLNGKAEFFSRVGEGTTLSVWIPMEGSECP
ncbi:GAF domain-containing sensor histidine kinase [Bacillus sp. 1P06AnD]|uniref:GAF domain-containing sensor histidine kinase n=1 Tax=Bacillus sp. 1P06AnD TaxID=3132208 RepID=UPI0039A37A3D